MRSKKKTGVTFLTVGIVLLITAITLMAFGVMGFVQSLKSVAVVTSPGTVTVQLDEPGTYVLWQDQISSGTSGSSSGLATHALTHLQTGTPAPFIVNSMSMNRTYGSTHSTGIGQFEITQAGQYEFSADHPDGAQEQFSLTAGAFGETLLSGPLAMVGALFLGFIGLAGTITGIVLLLVGKKSHPAPPLPPAHS